MTAIYPLVDALVKVTGEEIAWGTTDNGYIISYKDYDILLYHNPNEYYFFNRLQVYLDISENRVQKSTSILTIILAEIVQYAKAHGFSGVCCNSAFECITRGVLIFLGFHEINDPFFEESIKTLPHSNDFDMVTEWVKDFHSLYSLGSTRKLPKQKPSN